jgi:hypothetical protein
MNAAQIAQARQDRATAIASLTAARDALKTVLHFPVYEAEGRLDAQRIRDLILALGEGIGELGAAQRELGQNTVTVLP